MGRAIDMENSLSLLEARLLKAENALAKVIEIVDSMQEKASTTKPVKKAVVKKEKANATKEKADDKGDGEGSK